VKEKWKILKKCEANSKPWNNSQKK